ncbi:hypothetical protein K435DRAFT_792884 [Dendrothele bispora CBS 962.96]|uniref:Uncharacterized protein n=1 Tax=Dendrothele bispora (strain CBS 962.96) TaxID=1314807 RepID=A0A4S8MHD3_DENBC|nr:hypothetical protein K435DRAFT_792884 [Dendrothele bispora CBS 962.96]
MDAQNPMRPAVYSALKAREQYPMIVLPAEEVSVSDVAVPTMVHPGSTRDSPVHNEATPSIAMPIPTIEETRSRDDSFDEASSRDEDATKAFDRSMMLETPETFLHSSVQRSSPPIEVLPQEEDEDNRANNDDDEDEQDIEEDLTNQLDSSPIRPSTTR